MARQLTEELNFAPKNDKAGPSSTGTYDEGPTAYLHDYNRMKRWAIFTHGGFLTRTHHDGEGNGTVSLVTCGGKLWGHFKYPKREFSTREELFQAFDENFGDLEDDRYAGCVALDPGDLL
jgi:hypothetical protein